MDIYMDISIDLYLNLDTYIYISMYQDLDYIYIHIPPVLAVGHSRAIWPVWAAPPHMYIYIYTHIYI